MLLSMIVPFYNAEDTFTEMLASLPKGAVNDSIEYIFVDDGSTDGSLSVLESFLTAHPLINAVIIRNDANEGVASAYSKGLAKANGDYIGRIDADDILIPSAFCRMLDLLREGNPDIVRSSYVRLTDGRRKIVDKRKRSSDLNEMPVDTTSFALWGKLIRRDFLEKNALGVTPGVDCWEDLAILAPAFALTGKVVTFPETTYVYRRDSHLKSVSRKDNLFVTLDRIFYANQVARWFETHGLTEKYQPFIDRMKFASKIKYLRFASYDIPAWLTVFPEINRRVMKIKYVPLWIRTGARIIVFISKIFISDRDSV